MADRPTNLPDPGAEAPSGPKTAPDRSHRLESWKEIASYLKRDLRTVQRWEKREGLPVHRHLHDERATVYAFKTELDAWWHDGHSQLEKENGKAPEEESSGSVYGASSGQASVAGGNEPRVWRRWGIWFAGAAVISAASAAIAIYVLRPQPTPLLNFHSRDLVLIASFENRTGEPVFDGTLKEALGRELTNSRFVSVVPRVRINDTLALMRKPASTRVDAALGREICLRDGGIRALITGSIAKLGDTYVLSASLVDPTNGRTVAGFEDQVKSQGDVLTAIHRVGNRLRQTLGENLSQIRQSDLALQKVTTPSLKALQLYSQADREIYTEGPDSQRVAFDLLKQAIAEDPNFASAYLLAAYSLANQGRPSQEYIPYAKRALELSGQTSEPERYFIQGSWYQFSNKWDLATSAYEALLKIDPTHYWGMNNLFLLVFQGEREERQSIDLAVHLAKLRPNNFHWNARAGYLLAIEAENPGGARPYLMRARKLIGATSYPSDDHAEESAWIRVYPAYQAWMKNDVGLAQTDLSRLGRSLDPQDDRLGALPLSLGTFSLTLGRGRDAVAWYQRVSPSLPQNPELFATLAYVLGEGQALRRQLRRIASLPEPYQPYPISISLMIREGLLRKAAAAIRRSYPRSQWHGAPYGHVEVMLGELYLAQGKTTRGISLLSDGVRLTRMAALPIYFLGAESLASAYEKQGNISAALSVLEDASTNRPRVDSLYVDVGVMACGPFWMRDQMDLARLYRRMGRVKDAEKIEAEMRKLLAYADPDFPMLVELKQLQKADATARKQD